MTFVTAQFDQYNDYGIVMFLTQENLKREEFETYREQISGAQHKIMEKYVEMVNQSAQTECVGNISDRFRDDCLQILQQL